MDLVASLKAVAVLACIRGVVRILTFILSGDFQTFKRSVFEVVLRLIFFCTILFLDLVARGQDPLTSS